MKIDKIKNFRLKYVFDEIIENFLADFVVDLTNDVISEHSGRSGFVVTNKKFSEVLRDLAENVVYYKDVEEFRSLFSIDKLLLKCMEAASSEPVDGSEEKNSKIITEFRYKTDEGEIKWCKVTLNCIERQGKYLIYAIVEDIDDFKRKLTDLTYKAEHDALTKLKNKTATEAAVNRYLFTQGLEGLHALFCFDVDNFKNINNAFGHVFGDVFLVETANVVRSLFRKDDILGRIGGDEFVIFMKDIGSRNVAYRRAEEILSSIKKAFVDYGKDFNTTISVGMSFYDKSNKTYSELLKEADTAMYYCKNSGKNKYAEYNNDMDLTTLIKSGIDTQEKSAAREDNACEYIFRVLRDNADRHNAISLALKLICQYFDIDGVTVYDNASKSFTYKHSSKGSQDTNLDQLLKFKPTSEYWDCFEDGVFIFAKGKKNISAKVTEYFSTAQCSSAIQFCSIEAGSIMGVMSFYRYGSSQPFSERDASILRNIANLIYFRLKY